MKQISLELVRVTEDAAIAAAKWIGSGNKESADKAATDAMRKRLNKIPFGGKIVIGEGEKDESYGLFAGEFVGLYAYQLNDPNAPYDYSGSYVYDIAVDPIDGTTPTVTSGPEAMSILGVAHCGCMLKTDQWYMNKLAYGPNIAKHINLSITDPIDKIVIDAAKASGKDVDEMMVCILDRKRHYGVISELRRIGARIKLIKDCDVSAAIATCIGDGNIDILYGIGGAPEAVITACAMKCLGGDFQVQYVIGDDKDALIPDTSKNVIYINDLVNGECAFVATGITNGSMLYGVKYDGSNPVTHSLMVRSDSKTIREIKTKHGN